VARAWAEELPDSRRRCYKGLLLELATLVALRKLGLKPYYRADASAWARTLGKSCDLLLAGRKLRLQIETKNWRSYKVSPQLAEEEVLPRFSEGAGGKLLIVSAMKRWSPGARRLLAQHKILVLELGFVVTAANLGRAVAVLAQRLTAILGIYNAGNRHNFGYLLALRRPASSPVLSPPVFQVVGAGVRFPDGARGRGPPRSGLGGAGLKRPEGTGLQLSNLAYQEARRRNKKGKGLR